MSNLLLDFRYSLRALFRRPGLTVLAILAIALGIGAATAIFSVVNAVLLRALPYQDPERLVMIWESNPAQGEEQSPVSPPLIVDWRNEKETFESVAGYWLPSANFITRDGEPARVTVADVTGNFFSILGARPSQGRLIQEADDQPGSERLVVLSHGFWQRYFGGEDVTGKSLTLDGAAHTIIGVMPPHFNFPEKTEVWRTSGLPLAVIGRNARFLQAVGRLEDGVTLERARARLGETAVRLEQDFPDSNTGWTASVASLPEHLVGGIRPALLILFSAVAFVLLIACVNVTNLLLARVAARRGEIALRAALGSSRTQLLRQLVIESLIITCTGGLLALLFVWWGIDFLIALVPTEIPRLDEVAVNWQVVAFTLALVLATGLLIGLIPALRFSSSSDLVTHLKSAAGQRARRISSLHGGLVVVEVAVAMIVLAGAGLLIGSFARLTQVRPGFNLENVLTFNVQIPASKYEGPAVTNSVVEVLRNLSEVPGVKSTAATAFLPLDATAWNLDLSIVGRVLPPGEKLSAQYHSVTPDYFRTLQIPLLSGRELTQQDDATSHGVVVINQAMARHFWPDGDAIGKTVIPASRNFGPLGRIYPEEFEVVGIVEDVRNNGLQSEAQPAMFFSHRQFVYQSMNFVVRSQGSPEGIAAPVRARFWAVDREVPISDLATMEELVGSSLAQMRFNALLLGVFASIALLLAAVGIYGVLAYGVSQRTQEIGVRMALGGQRSDILRLMLWYGLRLTLVGLVLGVVGALATGRLLKNLLFEVSPTDPLVFMLITAILLAVATIACILPARRAMRTNPIAALRHD